MSIPGTRKALPSFTVAALLALVLTLLSGSAPLGRDSGPVYALHAPPVAAAPTSAQVGLDAVIEEAGIAAWFQTPSSITLADVRDAYRTIEAETADYIIGSVPVANYPETEDVHVYVHTDGWILAYYLAADPVGKIYDWRVYHDTGRVSISTKLENTIAVIAGEAGMAFTGATHYHFAHPSATHMMLIVEWTEVSTSDSFEVNLTGSYAYLERSWSIGSADDAPHYRLDGASIYAGHYTSGWMTAQGTLEPAQLLTDQFHTVEIDSYGSGNDYGGLALVYRVP